VAIAVLTALYAVYARSAGRVLVLVLRLFAGPLVHRLWAAGLLLGVSATAHAVPATASNPEEPQVVVTSSRLSQPPVASSTTVEADQIEAQRSADVLNLLTLVPGVAATQPGGAGGVSEVFLRGAESNFATVIIDGVKVNDPSNTRGGGYDFSTLNPDEIQRIEIARGPLSAVQGSDALSGVINIVTRAPATDFTVHTRGEAGTQGYARAFAALSGPVSESLRAGLKAGYLDSGEVAQGSSQKLNTVQADLDAHPSAATSVRGGVRFADRQRTSFPDASGGPLFGSSRDLEEARAQETSAWARVHHAVSADWELDTFAAFYTREEEVQTPAIAPGVFDAVPASSGDTRFRRAQLTFNNSVTVDPAFEVGAGLDFELEDGHRDGRIDLGFVQLPSRFDSHRLTSAAYTEARYASANGIEVYGAARLEASEHDKSRASGRFSIQHQRSPADVLLRASIANGYKRPSFYALGDTLVGNPELDTETSTTLELAAEKSFAAGLWTASATAFRSRYNNLIDFDFATFRLVNRSLARSEGVELAATFNPLRTVSVQLHGTFSHIELNRGEDELFYRPESYGGMRVDWRPSTLWTVHADAQAVGKRLGSSVPTGVQSMRAYTRVNLAVARKVGKRATLFAAVDNLLNDAYQQGVGFPDSGVQARLGASLNFLN